jgi:hypothetical protein
VGAIPKLAEQASSQQILDLFLRDAQAFGGFFERAEFSDCRSVHVYSYLIRLRSGPSGVPGC